MASCRCGGSAAYTRRYSGESLCAKCFRDSVVEKTRKTISKHGMLHRGETVGVAVSGGKDSLSLLHVLGSMSKERGYQLVALTVDEGVEGYRGEAIEHARAMAEEFGVRQVVLSYKELYGFDLDGALRWDGRRDLSSCSICGVFRRRAIDEAAARAGVDVIATAHNLDDAAQTFLMNLLNGDVGRIGWSDPSAADVDFPLRRVKPFMELYEEEIAFYAYLAGIPFQSVSCPYMHEGLRSEVRDFLNELEARHAGIKNVLLSSSLQVSSRLVSSTPRRSVPCSGCGKPSSSGVCNVCRLRGIIREQTKYSL